MCAHVSDARLSGLTLEHDGAAYLPGAARGLLDLLDTLAATTPPGRAGTRLTGAAPKALVSPGTALHAPAAGRLGKRTRAVRMLFFDKSDSTNWALGWHQDRTIVVRERHAVEGFGPWTVKAGLLHVAPPFPLLSRMVTMRVHLDPVPPDNGPLLIAPGSHLLGRIAEPDIAAAVRRNGTVACCAERGDIWLYVTPILHASDRAASGQRRRVLQIDFSADSLPAPLEWRGL